MYVTATACSTSCNNISAMERNTYKQYIHTRAVLRAYDFDQHAAESRDCNIDQVSYREARGLEINADHGSNLEIDEQEENVSEEKSKYRRKFNSLKNKSHLYLQTHTQRHAS